MAREKWTAEQLSDFREWHNNRLEVLNYPEEVKKELTRAREKWLPAKISEVKDERSNS